MTRLRTCLLAVIVLFTLAPSASAQRLEVPRRHDRPPGPPLTPQEAVARMTVPEGFSVEIVAAEPDVVNPVAMCIDEKGRFWVTESFEYPRREPGPGRDRVKVLEDTDGDGKVDKVTVFADGLNIPSGIAVGYGGVWVANAPDILFMQDTDGDLKADKIEKVVTGFGRLDTHELPNSLTWGPDGWLYGLNGVFNNSHVKYTPENPNYEADHAGWPLTCAMFRIHPRTREFQIFAEGTSNPWGIAFNDEGDAFISACVIDHLWHIVESGYYIRQGGPYPPHTWPMRSIVDHKHQKAAYCGIEWFDSDAYPEEYRNVLYMGNIHGGCINADIVERSGSTYKGKPHPGFPAKPGAWDDDEYDTIRKTGEPENPKLADFLTANDPWFMPVVQKTGPDGCLYILDWYDRYHCYQDANADPEGVDRGKGRLYRVRYKDTPHAQPFDLAKESDEELVERLLNGGNEYVRSTSRRLLAQRLGEPEHNRAMVPKLQQLAMNTTAPTHNRLQALWALASAGRLNKATCSSLLRDQSVGVRRWCIRFASELAETKSDAEALAKSVGIPAQETPREVLLQMAVSFPKMIEQIERERRPDRQIDVDPLVLIPLLIAKAGSDDHLVQHAAWQNLYPFIEMSPYDFADVVTQVRKRVGLGGLQPILERAIGPVVDASIQHKQANFIGLYVLALLDDDAIGEDLASQVLKRIVADLRNGTLDDEASKELRFTPLFKERMDTEAGNPEGALYHDVMALRALWGDDDASQYLLGLIPKEDISNAKRLDALRTLASIDHPQTTRRIEELLASENADSQLRTQVIEFLGVLTSRDIATLLLKRFDTLDEAAKPKAIEVLTQRPQWSIELLRAIKDKQIDKNALNLNQLKRLALLKNDELQGLLAETYGAIRQDRRSDRQQVINFHRDFLNGTPGDPERGIAAFKKVCGQCHKMYGEGAEVGPDITRNGRNNWEQLLQNVFDPSAVIGPGYQARTLVTLDGRVLTGLPVEESDQRVVLRIQGGKTETIPRDQIEAYAVSEMSMMPEDLEKQLTPQEIADLFAFLALDKPPGDPTGKLLPGAPQPKSR